MNIPEDDEVAGRIVSNTATGTGETPRGPNVVKDPVDGMTNAQTKHCVEALRLVYADQLRRYDRDVVELEVKVARLEYELAGWKLAKANERRAEVCAKERAS